MFLDVFQERGLNDVDIRFGDPNYCFFPLFDWIHPPAVQQACVLYSIMWAGKLVFFHSLSLAQFSPIRKGGNKWVLLN